MKAKLFRALLLIAMIHTLNSCSPEALGTPSTVASTTSASASQKAIVYTYNSDELEAMSLINAYRVSIGLNTLEQVNYISHKSEQHNTYMIATNLVNHNDFVSRSGDIVKVLGAKTVSENIAYNYNTPQAALKAWLNSPSHKENIEGSFTHFGISIRIDAVSGKKYYTNMFAKI